MDTPTNSPETNTNRPLLAVALAFLAGMLRILPHAWNLVPMGAIGVFSGAKLRGWRAFAVPVGVRLATDLILWWKYPEYPPFFPFEYLSCILCVFVGWMLIKKASTWRVLGTGLTAGVIFFIVSNFGAWVQLTDDYPRSLAGLIDCYVKGLAFYRDSRLGYLSPFAGDLVYTPVLFGSYALLSRWLPRTAPVPQPAAEAAETV
jgi:hypothetical protein